MKKLFIVLLAFALCFLVLGANASGKSKSKTTTVTGHIGDDKCGAHGAEKADCVAKCIGAGAKPILVSDKDQSVLNIDNPDAVKDHYGHHVTVKGTVSNGSIHVTGVTMVKEKPATTDKTKS